MSVPRHILFPVLFLGSLAIQATATPDDTIRRGHYFVAEAEGFELWIPGRVNRKDNPREGMVGEFGIMARGMFLQMYITASNKTLEEFLEERSQKASSTFQGGKLKSIERLDGCRHPTAVALHTDIDSVAGYEEKDFIVAAADMEGRKTVNLYIISAKGLGKQVLPVVKWMVSTLRFSGERGLNSLMAPRCMHTDSGLSIRIPTQFQKQAAGEKTICEASDETTGDRLVIRKESPEAKEALTGQAEDKKNEGKVRLITLPHPEKAAVFLVFHPPEEAGKPGMARAVVEFEGDRFFTIDVTGTSDRKDALLRSAELTASSLKWIDVEAIKARVITAAGDLNRAIKKKNKALINDLIQTLATGAFLPSARQAIENAMPKLAEEDQILVVQALSASEDRSTLPALIKLYKNSKFKKRLAMRREVLKACRYLRDPAALKLLLSEAGEKDPSIAATALFSLGYYKKERAEVLRKIIPLFKKAEALKKSSRLRSRERWAILFPAFEKAIKRLTGQGFLYAKDAQDWYRANKTNL